MNPSRATSNPPSAIYVWLVPSEEVLDQPGSWRIRKWDTEPFPEANYTLGTASEREFSTEEAAIARRLFDAAYKWQNDPHALSALDTAIEEYRAHLYGVPGDRGREAGRAAAGKDESQHETAATPPSSCAVSAAGGKAVEEMKAFARRIEDQRDHFRVALETIRDECFNGAAHDIAERALNEAGVSSAPSPERLTAHDRAEEALSLALPWMQCTVQDNHEMERRLQAAKAQVREAIAALRCLSTLSQRTPPAEQGKS